MSTDLSEGAGLQENLDLVAAQYDELPYQSFPFAPSHPARMAAVAQFFGLEAPRLETARVLELGCASGGNIIPHAAFYPQARFVGVDLSQRQVEDGQARIARLGLDNIELRNLSISDIGEELGKFDYIISHGVFSWVPEPVREDLLRVSRQNLTPNGMVYLSFNVLPGWRLRQPLRDACKEFIPESLPLATRAQMARELFDFFRDQAYNNGPYGDMLRAAPDRIEGHSDDQIFHEYLEESNDPMLFSDFAVAADRHGLGYLADAELEWMFPEQMRPGLEQAIRQRMSGDRLSVELMLDFLTGRSFRRSLLVANESVGKVSRNVTLERLRGLHFHGRRDLKLEITGTDVELKGDKGRSLKSDDPGVKQLLTLMMRRFPGSVSLEECEAELPPEQHLAMAQTLLRMATAGFVIPTSTPLPAG